MREKTIKYRVKTLRENLDYTGVIGISGFSVDYMYAVHVYKYKLDGNFCLGWELFKEEPAVHGGQGERFNNILSKTINMLNSHSL